MGPCLTRRPTRDLARQSEVGIDRRPFEGILIIYTDEAAIATAYRDSGLRGARRCHVRPHPGRFLLKAT